MISSSNLFSNKEKQSISLSKLKAMYHKLNILQSHLYTIQDIISNSEVSWNTCNLPDTDWFNNVMMEVDKWCKDIECNKEEIEKYSEWLADSKGVNKVKFDMDFLEEE